MELWASLVWFCAVSLLGVVLATDAKPHDTELLGSEITNALIF